MGERFTTGGRVRAARHTGGVYLTSSVVISGAGPHSTTSRTIVLKMQKNDAKRPISDAKPCAQSPLL
jgi:hypothetical protein